MMFSPVLGSDFGSKFTEMNDFYGFLQTAD
jgi:hypothetical protein